MKRLFKLLSTFFVFILTLVNTGLCADTSKVPFLTLLQTLPTGNNPYYVAFSPTSQSFAITNFDDNSVMVFILNPSTGKFDLAQTLPTGSSPFQVAISNDNKLAVTANIDGTLSIFTIDESGRFTALKSIEMSDVSSIALSSDNLYAVVTNSTNTPAIHSLSFYKMDTSTGDFLLVQTLETDNFPGGVVLSNDDDIVAITISAGATVYTVKGGSIQPLQTITFEGLTNCIAISPDQKLAAIGCFAGPRYFNIYSIDPSSGKFSYLNKITVGGGSIYMSFFPLGNAAISLYNGNSLAVWSVNPNGTFSQAQLLTLESGMGDLACSPDGKFVVAFSYDTQTAWVYQTSFTAKADP